MILSTTCELGKVGSVTPTLQRRIQRLGEVKRLPKVTELVSDGARIWGQVLLVPAASFSLHSTVPLGHILQMLLCCLQLTGSPELS